MASQTTEYNYEASSYDESRFSNKIGRHLDYMHKKIVQDLNIFGKLILDAGTGTGRFATWLAKKGFEVIGVDLSPKMLKVARKKMKALNVDVGLLLADLRFLPFKPGVFNGCVCINVIDHLSDISKFLKDVNRVLKSDGCYIFNFSNILSPYLPIALIVNFREKALFKGKIRSKWFTFMKMRILLREAGFELMGLRGCMIASPLPLGDRFIKIVQPINLLAESSQLKIFSGSIFIKARPVLTMH
jgi:ubiquinone/menaquinone biosynthesis C-methylase UbiE